VTSSAGEVITTNGSTLCASFSNLLNCVLYRFTFAVRSSVGTSLPGSSAVSLDRATVPGSPAAGANAGDASADVEWTAPSNGGSAITYYPLTVSPGGTSVTSDCATFSAEIRGLTSGTSYTFKGVATNAVGDSISGSSGEVTPTAGTPPTAGVEPAAGPTSGDSWLSGLFNDGSMFLSAEQARQTAIGFGHFFGPAQRSRWQSLAL
jgi:hypothetical protein